MKKYSVLGAISTQKFLREYWHKQPLLIRQAIPGFTPLLTRDALFGLAADDKVESRLVAREGSGWRFDYGPFRRLPSARKREWTLLVQGVNLHDDNAASLLEQFRFIPNARLDDLMISYASDGGGVGPHFDSYDVFLLQASGKRKWRISAQQDLRLVENLPLKILKHFEPEQEFILEPGDMLYLPPYYAHDGTAIGECMTYSIGFRAPTYQELGESFLQFMADSLDLPGRYADPDLRPTDRPAAIQDAMFNQVASRLRELRPDDNDIAIFLGEYLSEPKPSVTFDAPHSPPSRSRFLATAGKRGLRLARQSKLLYRGRYIFLNGESFVVPRADQAILRELGDARALEPASIKQASDDVRDALFSWYCDGWLSFP